MFRMLWICHKSPRTICLQNKDQVIIPENKVVGLRSHTLRSRSLSSALSDAKRNCLSLALLRDGAFSCH